MEERDILKINDHDDLVENISNLCKVMQFALYLLCLKYFISLFGIFS